MPHPYLACFDQEELPSNPNLTFDYIEQHIADVTSFWAAGQLEKLVQYIKKLIDSNIYDIRLLSFYFYSLWAKDDSDCSLDQVLVAFQQLLKQPLSVWLLKDEETEDAEKDSDNASDRLSESEKQHLINSLNLFFNRVGQRLERFSGQEDFTEAHPCKIIKNSQQFAKLLDETFQLPDMVPQVTQINRHFEDSCAQEIAEAEAEAEAEAISIKEQETESTDDIDKREQTNRHEETTAPREKISTQQAPTQAPQHSLAMQQLLNKLQIFETLMAEKNTYKAAIVFESIQKELLEFNPLHYLPELFSGYAKTHALYASELSQLTQHHKDTQSQALKDYFAIDPNGFLQLDIQENLQEQGQRHDVDDMDTYQQASRHSRFSDESDDFDDDD